MDFSWNLRHLQRDSIRQNLREPLPRGIQKAAFLRRHEVTSGVEVLETPETATEGKIVGVDLGQEGFKVAHAGRVPVTETAVNSSPRRRS